MIFLKRKKKTKHCFCHRDFTVEEIISLIVFLRKKENIIKYKNCFFDLKRTGMLNELKIDSDENLLESKDKIKLFCDELNAMFRKFNLNTCKRKIHFLSQMYLETMRFRASEEAVSSICVNYFGGCDFRGTRDEAIDP